MQAFAEIVVTGVKGDVKSNVELTLALRKETCESPKWKIQGLFAKSEQEVDQALRALGYYQAKIKSKLRFTDSCWTADFIIDPGPQTFVKAVRLTITGEAQNDPEFVKLRTSAHGLIGKPLHHGVYENLKSRIQSLAMARGYLQGEFSEKKLIVDPKQSSATYQLVFNSQKRMSFGEVTIEQDILRPDFVEKFVHIKPGEYYSSEQLAATYQALSQSGYFANIDIRPDMAGTGRIIPVNIRLQPKKKHHYEAGIGFDTDIGPLLSGVYSNRRLNDRGHYLTTSLDLSPVLSTAELQYHVPLAKPITDFFTLGVGLKREDTKTFRSMAGTISARFTHALSRSWRQILYLDYLYEDFATADQSNQTLLLVPGGSWQLTFMDNPIRPMRAYRAKIDLSGSYKNPISDVSFLQGAISGLWSYPLPFKGKFIGRGEFGGMLVDNFYKLPTTYRFYAGGINSVRGYGYKELGPRNKRGVVEGGQFLGVLSAEYEQAILDNWSLAVFVDTGNAFNLDKINFKTGAGLGVRWYSPFGPIRVDFAVPLNQSDSAFQVHFAAGARL